MHAATIGKTAALASALALLVATACDPFTFYNPPEKTTTDYWSDGGLGSGCDYDTPCNAPLLCAPYLQQCVAPCATASDCNQSTATQGDVCAPIESGWDASYCASSCTDAGARSDIACVEGVPTPCALVDAGSFCGTCGCFILENESVCDPQTNTCVLPLGLNSPCSSNIGCTSANCGFLGPTNGGAPTADDGGTDAADDANDSLADASTPMRCMVAVDDPCTDENCGSCTSLYGYPTCAQACATSADCPAYTANPVCGNWPCIGAPGHAYCREPCDPLLTNSCAAGLSCDPAPGACDEAGIASACQP